MWLPLASTAVTGTTAVPSTVLYLVLYSKSAEAEAYRGSTTNKRPLITDVSCYTACKVE